jgi:TonB family protein
MRKVLLLGVLIATGAVAQGPSLRWEEFHPPVYPQMARVARIQGQVALQFTLQHEGTVALQKSTGHPLLVQAAEESLKTSKLGCDDCKDLTPIFTVVFDFQVAEHDCRDQEVTPKQRANLNGTNRVSIVVQPECTDDPIVHYKRVRSLRCLYLWKCAMRPE